MCLLHTPRLTVVTAENKEPVICLQSPRNQSLATLRTPDHNNIRVCVSASSNHSNSSADIMEVKPHGRFYPAYSVHSRYVKNATYLLFNIFPNYMSNSRLICHQIVVFHRILKKRLIVFAASQRS